ncbi:MbcA/ParS/Xre antitoxin family protein [Deinococcus cavernae]|nr:MbcA/ParS/Xre antitoxin family protein [Deinococcus cavernae]
MRPQLTAEPLLNQQTVNINDPKEAARLSSALPAVIQMLEQFHLTREDQAILLGVSTRTLQRAVHGDLPALSPDQITRMSFITGIYKALHILFNDATASGWFKRPNRVYPFLGRTPLDYLRQTGIPGLQDTRRLLDGDRSGQFSSTPASRVAAEQLPFQISPDLLR